MTSRLCTRTSGPSFGRVCQHYAEMSSTLQLLGVTDVNGLNLDEVVNFGDNGVEVSMISKAFSMFTFKHISVGVSRHGRHRQERPSSEQESRSLSRGLDLSSALY